MSEVRPRVPTVISTFAGCGGSSLGYKIAGWRELLAVEWDQAACDTFRANFPGVPVYQGDIAALSVDECMEIARIDGPGELDVLDGSPPCQGFSISNPRRNTNDSRNKLFEQYVRLLGGLKPRAFVMENVVGMVFGTMKGVFLEIMGAFRSCGYVVKCAKLNSSWYGVPQSRNRLVFVGVRNDYGEVPTYPRPCMAAISVEAGLKGLENDPCEVRYLVDVCPKTVRERLRKLSYGEHPTGTGFSSVKIDPKKPCGTITKSDGVIAYDGNCHWSQYRKLTIGEVMRIMSFPDDFVFVERDKWWEKPNAKKIYAAIVGQMGNAVPPLMMAAVAKHIMAVILPKCWRKDATRNRSSSDKHRRGRRSANDHSMVPADEG